MKRNSGMPIFDRIKAGNAFILLLAACLSMALFSCSSSSSTTSTPDAKVNQHLAYQHLLDKDATLKPYQTVVLNLSSLENDHLSASPGSGYHNLPYEITNAGKYKYCIPDEDTHLTRVELFDPAGGLVGNWEKGEPCTSVPLVPGKYTIHVHLDTMEADPPIFMKPHDVTATQTGTMKAAFKSVASSDGQIPMNQFLNLKVDSLTDILLRNKAQGLQQQGWGVSVRLAMYNWDTSYFYQDPYWSMRDSQLNEWELFYFNREQGNVSISQGNTRLSLIYELDNDNAETIYMSWESYNTTFAKSSTFFKFSPSGTGFTLYDPNSKKIALRWVDHSTDTYTEKINNDNFKFNIKVRYGTTSGVAYPAMLANEVALFDGTYGPSGFPDNTHYWIINADMKDFNDFAFDNPTNRIKTVIAGRGARAQIYLNPSFQGDSVYVSPPVDGELLMTGTDNELLKNGTIGSIRVEANTNDIPVNEYEYSIVVSAKTCIGCDLRGFDASALGGLTKADFSYSDLSCSNISLNSGKGGKIENSNFTNTNFNNATLSQNTFIGCNFKGTNFTKAVLKNVTFDANQSASNSFYNSCPKFEYADLTTVNSFDKAFYIQNGYNAATWWNNGQPLCRSSIANSKVTADLFKDKHLWQFVDASGVDFSNMNLDGAVFAGSNLSGSKFTPKLPAKFTNASLKGAVFVKANLANVDLTGADLTGAHLEGATLTGVDLHKAKTLSKSYLSGITLNAPTNLAGLDMSGAILKGGSYKNWDGYDFGNFHPASIIGAYMFNTMLNGADLSGALLSNVSWFGDKATGENAVMDGTHFETADLPGLKLTQAHLQNANFTNAVLVNADFSTTTLDHSFNGTSFYQANLKGANLSGANLTGATLTGAFISTSSGQITLEVLDDPATNPNQYKYFYQNYLATTPPASTNGVSSCPDGNPPPLGGCGAITSQYWVSKAKPQDPAGCVPDGQGGLTCQSQRHPKQ